LVTDFKLNRPSLRQALLAAAAVILITVLMLPLRGLLDKAHVALLFLIVVLISSARLGRTLGIATAVLTFLAFNFFFLPPHHTLIIADPRDWLVLATYLVTAGIAAQLFHREHVVAELARQAEHASALAEADRLKDALLAAVSHDLRTPLTTIIANAHEIAESGDHRALAIEAEANRLNELVVDLLDLSKLQAGAVLLAPQVNEASDLIGAALHEVTSRLHDRVVNVAIEPANATLFGKFDFVHSLRVLVNLIDNAHKYSPPGTSIDVSARRDGDTLAFAVADRGPGISNAERHLIYQPFYRTRATAEKTGGTGLGLTIAKRLAELQGGVLRHTPRAGGGSVFAFRVPVAEVPESVEA
jgi:K+-sensing histidine kinase KdpD